MGYDKAFDDSVLGTFVTYAKSKSDTANVELKSHNYEFGVYARKYIGANEIDAKFAVGKAKNKLDRLSNKSKFDSKFAEISLDYGYVFDISNDMFLKPIVGLNYTYIKNDSFGENGALPLIFDGAKTKALSANLALEFRKYTQNGSYFYITPGVSRESFIKT